MTVLDYLKKIEYNDKVGEGINALEELFTNTSISDLQDMKVYLMMQDGEQAKKILHVMDRLENAFEAVNSNIDSYSEQYREFLNMIEECNEKGVTAKEFAKAQEDKPYYDVVYKDLQFMVADSTTGISVLKTVYSISEWRELEDDELSEPGETTFYIRNKITGKEVDTKTDPYFADYELMVSMNGIISLLQYGAVISFADSKIYEVFFGKRNH